MKKLTCSALALLLVTGCAHFSTEQIDQRGTDQTITTKVSAYTFFSSASNLSQFKASQTDKTQGASVGNLNQNTDVSTNWGVILGTMMGTALKTAVTK